MTKKKNPKENKLNDKFNKIKKPPYTEMPELPPYMYIVCEGIKTEPTYVKEMVNEINNKFHNYSFQDRIIVEGTGKNTRGLLEYARNSVEENMPEAEVVWLVYDKDDFPKDNFDNTQFSAETKTDKRKFKVAWSNECFELWLLLHFQEMGSDTGRKHCRELLSKHLGKKYKKNLEGMHEILKDRIDIAIKRAKKLYKENEHIKNNPSKMCPCTRVFELVEELRKYL